jgi:hypothetical protein
LKYSNWNIGKVSHLFAQLYATQVVKFWARICFAYSVYVRFAILGKTAAADRGQNTIMDAWGIGVNPGGMGEDASSLVFVVGGEYLIIPPTFWHV